MNLHQEKFYLLEPPVKLQVLRLICEIKMKNYIR